jgi:hypothetical protein
VELMTSDHLADIGIADDANPASRAATWDGAREKASDWVTHSAMTIRGRSKAIDLYAVPLA